MYAVKKETVPQGPKIKGIYRIVQYPDKDSPSGKVFFVDEQVVKWFLWLFPYKKWVTVRGAISGKSLFWYHFTDCTNAVTNFKQGVQKHI